jgi:hypothetical protein
LAWTLHTFLAVLLPGLWLTVPFTIIGIEAPVRC